MPKQYKTFTSNEKTSADGAMQTAKDSIDAAGKKVTAVQQSGANKVDDSIVEDLHNAKDLIGGALADLGGKPCGGGRPC